MPMRATWNGRVLAESSQTKVVEGNHYFPPESINWEYFQESSHHSTCPWKEQASYYDVVVDGEVNRNAAGYYTAHSKAARQIKDHVDFWYGVKVQRLSEEGEPEHGHKSLVSALFGR